MATAATIARLLSDWPPLTAEQVATIGTVTTPASTAAPAVEQAA